MNPDILSRLDDLGYNTSTPDLAVEATMSAYHLGRHMALVLLYQQSDLQLGGRTEPPRSSRPTLEELADDAA